MPPLGISFNFPFTRVTGVHWGFGIGAQVLAAFELYNPEPRAEYHGKHLDSNLDLVFWESDLEYAQYLWNRNAYIHDYDAFAANPGLATGTGDVFLPLVSVPIINNPELTFADFGPGDHLFNLYTPQQGQVVLRGVPFSTLLEIVNGPRQPGDPLYQNGVNDTSFWGDGIGDGNPATLVTERTNSFVVAYIPASQG